MKDYMSEVESKKDIPIPAKQTDTLTSLDDFAATHKKKIIN